MTNTHRKTTTRTTAKVAAVGAFGIGAAIAFPGLAAAQSAEAPAADTASTENQLDAGSLEGLTESLPAGSELGTDLQVDLGSLTFDLSLDAEAPTPGSVEFGSLGVSPNTGSDAVDGGSGGGAIDAGSLAEGSLGGESGSLDTGSLPGAPAEDGEDDDAETPEDSGSLDTGSLPGSSEGDEAGDTGSEAPGSDEAGDTESLTGELAGLSSGAEAGVEAEAEVGTGSLG